MLSLKITTRCHSVFSLRSPEALSRQVSEVATVRLATRSPELRVRISGSLPRFPTKITLLTLPAIGLLLDYVAFRGIRRRTPWGAGDDHQLMFLLRSCQLLL